MFLMVETGIRHEICHAILEYVKINNKYMKDYDKINNLAMSTIRMQMTYMDGQCHKLLVR